MKPFKILLLTSLLAACSGSFASLDDRELRQRHYQCQHAVSLSPAEIQVCQNIARECQRRAGNGNFAC